MKRIHAIGLINSIAILLLPALATASVTRLTNYNDLAAALKNGHRVNTVIDLSSCNHQNNTKRSDAITDITGMGFNFTNTFFTFMKDDKNRNLVTAITNNTMTAAGLTGDSAQRYKRVMIYDDNSVYIYGASADYTTGKVMAVDQYTCAVSNGHDKNAVSIFDYDV